MPTVLRMFGPGLLVAILVMVGSRIGLVVTGPIQLVLLKAIFPAF